MTTKGYPIKAADVADLLEEEDTYSFCIDTALSWDGTFPEPGEGDYLVEIGSIEGDGYVLVSRRYTGAIDADQAAEIALDAFAERRGFEADDEGKILPVTIWGESGIPVWVVRVQRVIGEIDEDIGDLELKVINDLADGDWEPEGE